MSGQEYQEIDYQELVRSTDKAGLFLIDDDEIWIPWSVVEDNGDLPENDSQIYVKQWFLDKEEIPY